MKKSLQRAVATGACAFAFVIATSASTFTTMAASTHGNSLRGNNGTLKVHEVGTPIGTENNDPKVCSFNLEGFGLDQGQSGYLTFDAQGKDQPHGVTTGTTYVFGPANADGYAVSQNFNAGGAIIADGHYKVTLYGKDMSKKHTDLDEVKAKSKVFKVDCAADDTKPETPVNPVKPTKPETANKPEKPETPVKPETPSVKNNGTLKVHEIGTPVKTMNNDPKVCAFDIEGFKFDSGQTGYLKFSVQGNDAPHGVASESVYAFGPTNSEGYAISATKFNTKDGVTIANGHYKVTLYGKAGMTDEKAKSKVFKVTCETPTVTPPNPVAPTTPTTPVTPNTPVTGGQVLGSATVAAVTAPTATIATTAGTLHDTGTSIVSTTLLASGLLMAALAIAYKRAAVTGLSQEQIDLIAL